MKSILAIAVLSLFVASCASKNTTAETPPTVPAAQASTTTTVDKVKPSTKKTGIKKTENTAAATSAAGEVNCKSGSDERKLAVVAKDSGCELQYTKAGQTSTIASQIMGNAKCESVMTSVKEKLIASGFNCQ